MGKSVRISNWCVPGPKQDICEHPVKAQDTWRKREQKDFKSQGMRRLQAVASCLTESRRGLARGGRGH